jgi:isopentenyl-diphosphate delta-isomerase
MEMLILVNEKDDEIGYAPKEECHIWPAKRHRAFSIFIFNSKTEMLIHKRAADKKTWPGFWTNACCSHPRKGELIQPTAERRLKEELGFTTKLKHLFTFEYSAQYDAKWGEHEIDWVFAGRYDGPVNPDPKEVAECRFVPIDDIQSDIIAHPERYTPWFKLCFDKVLEKLQKK